MRKLISCPSQLLSKFFVFIVISAICSPTYGQFINKKWPKQIIVAPNGQNIEISWAIKDEEKLQGLSGLMPSQMPKNSGLIFSYTNSRSRVFWMPNTFFDLDIVFMDKDFKIVAIESHVKHFIGKNPAQKIPKTKAHHSRYVLELHAGMAAKLKFKVNSKLIWKNQETTYKFLNKN